MGHNQKKMPYPILKEISISGFKSIQELKNFSPQPLNIFIGPNGAGKSNLIGFFKLVSWMLNSDGQLQEYIGFLGGASDVLHDGPDKTREILGAFAIETEAGLNEYQFTLSFAKPDRLQFKEEKYRFSRRELGSDAKWSDLGGGHLEAKLPTLDNPTASTIRNLLRKLIVYQFHNTSDTAAMRLSWSLNDGRWLKQNGENLGSFLLRLRETELPYYTRIVMYIRQILPFFHDFELYEEFGKVLLRWRERNTAKIFNAGQASDGMLRTIALVSLLAQPPKDLPTVLFLDEPELGLHPSAIDAVGGLIKAASQYCQVFVATQSISLVNNFEIEDLVVIDRPNRASLIHRPDIEQVRVYLEDYSTGQIWEKNIIGGRP